ncbi:FoF1-type ATP synthase, membrane subunit b or b' [Gordonia malaquae]|uniref:Uncharacterized protein n=1 Tax=Gordonia malaquae NBRC 108250 TaxID=1223542 RepID=M3UM37_GORML|nr:relaxase/mobilization nuclease domain-containing protein [Gordonia malaquae]GAC80850.1 hypothetical protein GM1_023_00090 [Gordonia malaquae NBRC 108250]SEB66952.1 FoF1-type ATP synthase, membrane subunit b or b' [Gordonia malaquae]
MVATMLSSVDSAWGLDDYLSAGTPAHDQANPAGPSQRVEYCSTIGDCRPETYLADVGRTRADYGKTKLELETYHLIFSHSHQELDPDDPYQVWLAHEFAKEASAKAFPGRQIKITTQADNGRWEESAQTGERVWVKGKIHSHCQIANVAEEAVTLEWTDKNGNAKTVHYPAGRAVSSDMKNLARIRYQVTDPLVMERFGFDNEAYMEACRGFGNDGNGNFGSLGAGDRKALARAAEGKTNAYDELRMRLRIARAQATDWGDYEARLAADGVHTLRRGGNGDGVSYKWIDADSGVASRPARAGGRSGVGDEFKYASVVEQCERNAAAIERGETLVVPERVLVVPTNSTAADRPKPVYLTADGKPPWEDDQALEAYAAQVRSTGGTYEGLAAQATVSAEPVEGVTLDENLHGQITATVDTPSGPLVMDVDETVAKRRKELDERFQDVRKELNAWKIELDDRERRIEDEVDEAVAARASAWKATERPRLDRDARAEGFAAGEAAGRAQAEKTITNAEEKAQGIITAAKTEARETKRAADAAAAQQEAELLSAMTEAIVQSKASEAVASGRADDPAAAAQSEREKYEKHPLKDLDQGKRLLGHVSSRFAHAGDQLQERAEAVAEQEAGVAEQLREASGLTPEQAAQRVLDEYSVKARDALESYWVPQVEYGEKGAVRAVTGSDGKQAYTTAWDQLQTDVAHGPGQGADVTVGQLRRDGRKAMRRADEAASLNRTSTKSQEKGFGQ